MPSGTYKRKRSADAHMLMVQRYPSSRATGGGNKKRKTSGSFRPGYNRTSGFYGRFSGRGELKFHDLTFNDPVISTQAVVPTVNIITQGTGESQRIGRKVSLKSFWWKGYLDFPPPDPPAPLVVPPEGEIVRFIVFIDKQANGAGASTSDLLQETNTNGFRNLANKDRFIFLYDKRHTLQRPYQAGGPNLFYTENQQRQFDIYKKLNLPIEFSGTNGSLNEIRSNNIGIAVFSRGHGARLLSSIRLRYSD